MSAILYSRPNSMAAWLKLDNFKTPNEAIDIVNRLGLSGQFLALGGGLEPDPQMEPDVDRPAPIRERPKYATNCGRDARVVEVR